MSTNLTLSEGESEEKADYEMTGGENDKGDNLKDFREKISHAKREEVEGKQKHSL